MKRHLGHIWRTASRKSSRMAIVLLDTPARGAIPLLADDGEHGRHHTNGALVISGAYCRQHPDQEILGHFSANCFHSRSHCKCPISSSTARSWLLIKLHELRIRIGSLLSPVSHACALETQIPCPFTQAKSSHQCNAAGSAQPAGLLPYGDSLLARNQVAATIILPPARYAIEAPTQVLQQVAEMRHFRVEDAVDAALLVVENVASTVVSMDDADFRCGRRRIAAYPSNRGAHDGLGISSSESSTPSQ